MILLAFSDSHGKTAPMDEAISREPEVGGLIFCGDIADDAEYLRLRYPRIPLYAVRGNNDYYCDDPYLLMPEPDGVRMYITHGHRERVKFGTQELVCRSRQQGCPLCVYGHTHIQEAKEKNGVFLLNPGSIRSSSGPYARITLSGGSFSVELRTLSKLSDWSWY